MSGNAVVRWNELLLEAAQKAPPSRVPLFRNLALESVAVYDAVNAIDRSYTPYFAKVQASHGASEEAAAAQAAHDTLVVLYPQQQAAFDAELAADLAGIPPGRAQQGIEIGQAVAQQILALRSNDGAGAVVPYTPPNQDPGQWQPTPPDFSPATTAHIPLMTTFAVPSGALFRPAPPPALTSPEYAENFNEVKALGSLTSTVRTADQTQVAFLWRLPLTNFQVWNRIAQDMATTQGTTLEQTARLFALMDMTESDGLETSYAAKYYYTLWRPITAIRDLRSGTINPDTQPDPTWTTLHPTTPAFPTYPSNAGAEGSTSATILASFFGTDHIAFQVHWDAYGFPGVTRSYDSFSAAQTEEGRSRVYGGIHYTFDVTAGWELGRQVGDYIFGHFLLPVSDQGDDGNSGAGIRSAARRPGGASGPAFEVSAIIQALSSSTSAPLASGPGSVSPQGAEDLRSGTTMIGDDSPVSSTPALTRSIALPTHTRVLDQVFASIRDNQPSGAFADDGGPAWEE
ncbi:MAG TPA: vanadium-dependent haloperoxidase [Gemmataceae bacterium]|nr:vanadium-dependent haloperoxidase [Gemmataceae bacterium]